LCDRTFELYLNKWMKKQSIKNGKK
jgi:hypothetical protein